MYYHNNLTIVFAIVEEPWLSMSGLFGYSNGARTTGTNSRGKSRRKFFKNTSFVSGVTPINKDKINQLKYCFIELKSALFIWEIYRKNIMGLKASVIEEVKLSIYKNR